MKHAFIMVLDSFSISATEDAEHFGDIRADTLGHITEACAKGKADNSHKGPLNLPNLTHLGLAKAHKGSTSFIPAGMDSNTEVISTYTWAHKMSSSKDTPSGHWEIASVPVLFEWGYFSNHKNSFPQELLDKLVKHANLPGYLSNCHSSSTVILDQLGKEHMKTSKPIFYTSTDSMFQIACHEETFSLDKLYKLCKITHEELTNSSYNISHVITHPFISNKASNFQHTSNHHNLAVEPPAPTMLQKLVDEKHSQVVSVSKIADIYTNYSITKKVKATGLDTLFDTTIKEMKEAGDNTIIFTNFIDFNSSWGHHHNITSYATGLELFNHHLPELMSLLHNDNILILTTDHSCNPTWTSTDHTREHIPVLVYGPKVKPGSLGHHETFTDISQTLAKYFGTSDMEYGKAMF